MSDLFRGPYAHSEHAPIFVQRCICPLACPEHPDSEEPAPDVLDDATIMDQAPVELLSSYVTPPAIVPVTIENAEQLLAENNISIQEMGELIAVRTSTGVITFSYELANALCQEILASRKRIELTLPETLDTTIQTLKQRAGHDMAPLVDLIEKMLKNKNG